MIRKILRALSLVKTEYTVDAVEVVSNYHGAADLQGHLNRMSSQGWELCSITTVFPNNQVMVVFKK